MAASIKTVPFAVNAYLGEMLQQVFDEMNIDRDYIKSKKKDESLNDVLDEVYRDLVEFRNMMEKKYDLHGNFYHIDEDFCTCPKCQQAEKDAQTEIYRSDVGPDEM